MKSHIPYLTTIAAALFPLHLFAQEFTYLYRLVGQFGALIRLLVPLLIAVALVLFIWGLVIYIAKSGDEKAIEEGRRKMIWGILALFVIVSVWGFVVLLQELSGIGGVQGIEAPQSYF